jgi:hypothetical protein
MDAETKIFTEKLFTKETGSLMELGEALKVSLVGAKAITRREKAKIYASYKAQYSLDKTRLVRKALFNLGNLGENNLVM